MPDTPDWDFDTYLDAIADNEAWNAELADIARAKGVASGLNCRSCGDVLGENPGPNCPACMTYLDEEEFQ